MPQKASSGSIPQERPVRMAGDDAAGRLDPDIQRVGSRQGDG